jgi:dTDP-4-amino-4,6-dideoxygalactose transaminase
MSADAAHPSRRLTVAPPLAPTTYLRRRRPRLPFPLEDQDHRLYARARHGLYHGVRALGIQPGDEALVPAYHHGSEIETLSRAGVICRFYDCDERLAPDEQQLESLRGPRTRLLFLIHYFGLPQEAAHWRAWCDRSGLMLLEDCAQAWLASSDGAPVGSYGDLAIFCLHKSVGLPDGGAMVSRHPPPRPSSRRPLGVRQVVLRHRDWVAQRAARLARTPPPELGAETRQEVPSRAFDLGDPDTPASRLTTYLLPRVDASAAAAKRRLHFEYLLDRLADAVPLPLRAVPAGAAPYVLVVACTEKDALLDHLAMHGIVGGSLWQTPHPLLGVADFPVARRLRSTLVGLPVHQELSSRDLHRIADVFERRTGCHAAGQRRA